MTYSVSQVSMDTLSNGNVVFSFADKRNEVPASMPLEKLHPFAYCYTQDGQPVWSTDGVEMPLIPKHDKAKSRIYGRDKVTISGDNIYFTAIMEEEVHEMVDDSMVVNYYFSFEVSCLDPNGNILQTRIDSVSDAFAYDLRPAPNGNAYLIYVNLENGYSAECINSTCQNIWSQPVVIDTMTVVTRSNRGLLAYPPSEIEPMSDDGLALVYPVFSDRGSSWLVYNRLYADGTTFADHIRLTDTLGFHASHICLFEGDTLTVIENRTHDMAADRKESYYWYNRVLLSNGQKLLDNPNGYMIDMEVEIIPEFINLVRTGGYLQLMSTEADNFYSTSKNYSTTYSLDGKLIQRKPIFGDELYISDFTVFNDGSNANVLLTKDWYGADGLWAACIDVVDYTHSAPVTNELNGKFSVNADGKQIVFSRANLQYLKYLQISHFATKQWETCNTYNKWIGTPTNINWIDMFGWGTGDEQGKYDSVPAAYPTFTDWGAGIIQNSAVEPGTWRTMTADEWDYLLNGRADAAQKRAIGRIEMGQIANPINGIILLPDIFEAPDSLTVNPNAQKYTENSYQTVEWKRLEANGAVFLPVNGYRKGVTLYEVNTGGSRGIKGFYWTSTTDGDSNAASIHTDDTGVAITSDPRSNGMSVRLIKDVDSEQGIEDVQSDQVQSTKVLRNGMLFIERNGRIYDAQGMLIEN